MIILFWQILEEAPELLGVLLSLKKMWEQYQDQDAKNKALVKMEGALDVARSTKDTSQLTALVNSILVNGGVPDSSKPTP